MRDLSDYSNLKAARFVSLVQRYKRRTDMQRVAGKTSKLNWLLKMILNPIMNKSVLLNE